SVSKETAWLFVSIFLDVGRFHVVEQRRHRLVPDFRLLPYPVPELGRDDRRELLGPAGPSRTAPIHLPGSAITNSAHPLLGKRRSREHRLLCDLLEITLGHRPRPPLSRSRSAFLDFASASRISFLPASSTAPAMPFTSTKASPSSASSPVSVIALPWR